MFRFLIPTLFLSALVTPLPAQSDAESRDKLEKGINKALHFLKTKQRNDGSWLLFRNPSSAATSLAVMSFLSAGHVPGEGPYADTVDKGIQWVLKNQRNNGLLAGSSYQMYEHGISTLMLAEVYGMTDPKTALKVKTALEKAVKIILQAQRTRGVHKGGWRYNITSPDADLSVTGWQLLALRAAKNVGCDIPAERIDMAVNYVKRSYVARGKDGGAFRYTMGGNETIPCTGTGILCLELCEKHHTRQATSAGAYLVKKTNLPRMGGVHFFYNVYYGSQATFQLGGSNWEIYRPHLHDLLLKNQGQDGSWGGNSRGGGFTHYGPVYGTSMCVLALTVEYRFLPIYQRDDDSGKDKK